MALQQAKVIKSKGEEELTLKRSSEEHMAKSNMEENKENNRMNLDDNEFDNWVSLSMKNKKLDNSTTSEDKELDKRSTTSEEQSLKDSAHTKSVPQKKFRGKKAGSKIQQERFMKFLFRLSSAADNWGNKYKSRPPYNRDNRDSNQQSKPSTSKLN